MIRVAKIQLLISNSNIRQFMRYIIVGIINTSVSYITYIVMLKFGFFYAVATSIGTVVGIVNSYFWNKFFAFKSKEKSVVEILRFISVYFVQYLCNLFVIFLYVTYFGISAEIAGLFGIGFAVLISYFGHKFWSFRS